MATYSAVQFFGADKVIEAYTARDLKYWGLFCGKDLQGCYEGKDIEEGAVMLQQWLDMLSESVGVYTLKVYDKLPEGGITDKTAAKGSFNFRLKEKGEVSTQASGAGGSLIMELYREEKRKNADLQRDMADMRAELDELANNKGEDVGAVGSFLKSMVQQPQFMQWAMGLFAPKPQPQYYPQPVNTAHPAAGALGNVSMPQSDTVEKMEPVQNALGDITEQELERLGNVYAQLRPKMPDAITMLEALLKISVEDPQRFEGIKSTIKMFL